MAAIALRGQVMGRHGIQHISCSAGVPGCCAACPRSPPLPLSLPSPAASPLPFAAPFYVMLGPPCLVLPCSICPLLPSVLGVGRVPFRGRSWVPSLSGRLLDPTGRCLCSVAGVIRTGGPARPLFTFYILPFALASVVVRYLSRVLDFGSVIFTIGNCRISM